MTPAEFNILALAKERGGKSLGVTLPTLEAAPKRSKYGNVPTLYNGVRYASKAEAVYAVALDVLLFNGVILGWTRQVRFMLGLPENIYVCDFVEWLNDGTTRATDVKGVRTSKFSRDCKLWARYGPCPLLIVTKGKVVETIVPQPREQVR